MDGNPSMTKDEAAALYNSAPVKSVAFSSYYKYVFTFAGENDVLRLAANWGGDHNDIYRHHINTAPITAPATFDELMASYGFVAITRKSDGAEFTESTDWF